MAKQYRRSLSFALTFAAAWTPIAQLSAQGQDASQLVSDPRPICMVRPQQDVPQVRAQDRGRPVYILVVEQSVPGLEARGFERVQCAGAGLNSPRDYAAYRDRFCELAGQGNEAVQNQIERALGERPAVLCANAEMIVGRWDRRGRNRGQPKD